MKTETTFSNSESGADDWDKILDEYESFVDKYIKLVKKAANGDMSAITEYASCLEQAEILSKKLEKAKSNLTSKQTSRFAKIQSKLLNAAADL